MSRKTVLRPMLAVAAIATGLGVAATAPAHAAGEATALTCAGTSQDGRDATAATPHSVRIVYANAKGEYLGLVETKFMKDGQVVAETFCEDPWVLADLPAGTYEVTSVYQGQTHTGRVTAPSQGATEYVVRF